MRFGPTLAFVPVVLLISCSSFEKRKAQFRERDGDEKMTFMAYFPYLTESQRDELLQLEAIDNRALAEISSQSNPISPIPNIPRAARVLEMRIDAPQTERGFAPKAFARWEGRPEFVEITRWVDWRVYSEFAHFERGEVIVNCGVEPILVEANFLGEARTEKQLDPGKRVSQLLVELDAKSDNLEQSRRQKARALAYCDDGSSSDISCGARWKVVSGEAKTASCGYVEVQTEPVTVQADYGGRTARAKLFFSRRP